MFNQVQLIGNLGKDPEAKATVNSHVCRLSVATSYKFKDNETVEWNSVVCWGKLAELCGRHLSKGSQVFVQGRLQTRSWEKDGQTKYTTEIVATEVKFLSHKPGSAETKESFAPSAEENPF